MRTIVYVDGFNLYYAIVGWAGCKWLDLYALSRQVLAGIVQPRVKKWELPKHRELWDRIHALVNYHGACSTAPPDLLVKAMRLYADKYHPAGKPHGIPESVRAIFTTQQAEVA